MSIYQKNLRRLGWLLIAVSVLDVILELSLYRYLYESALSFKRQMQTPAGICLKDGIGLTAGALACLLYYRKKYVRCIVRAEAALFVLTVSVILISTGGKLSSRIDSLINATVILSIMVVYTSLQMERSQLKWNRVSTLKASVLDLKLTDIHQWFNPIEIGPKLELNQEISSVVDRFLETSREARPLEITVHCPKKSSDAMEATMQEVFQMYYEDEERRVNAHLERLYIRAMALVILSIAAVSVWISFSPSGDEGITWTILSNFAAFSLWQIGSTYFERSEGYEELLRAQIAKHATIRFWAD